MPVIEVAEQAGVGADGEPRPSEDHLVVLDNAVVLLDGATAPSPDVPSGGWYAGLLSARLADGLRAAPEADLAAVLAASIAAVAEENGLRPGESPSSTVAIVRWTADRLDGLVLADSPIVVFGRGGPQLLADHRIASLRDNGKLQTGRDVRLRRNAEGGFWVAEADPAAAGQAVTASWPLPVVETVLLATDGVSCGIDDYHLFDWPRARALARERGAHAVLKAVREAEESDPDRVRWPRPKRHDDQALAVLDFR
ncbi:hypothetical protein [Amycolatopsis albispora]|uniref:PPM-type phosphatase domain-containing protein n=1 Tax=Amycolatopsis albispora TaxID=1804986 RepID=A0A344LEX6_9PSEU|nr:hypothetical protein [Amycolatopsis albispora]AXB46600.1 hypothetical protein A4R43_32595 [Amycolatopsis albispora]